jgi:hypothetical protein
VPDPDAHPDEVVLPAPVVVSHKFGGGNIRNGNAPNRLPLNQKGPPNIRQHSMPPPNGVPGNTNGGVSTIS